MRPKLFSLFAVSALALAGCSGSEPTVQPTATVTVTATPIEPTDEAHEQELLDELSSQKSEEEITKAIESSETRFYREARARAPIAGDHDEVVEAEYAEALNSYCQDGEAITVSGIQEFNEQLESLATQRYCEAFEYN